MAEFLQFTLDKFTFKVATDRFYSAEGVWAQAGGRSVRLGLSDFFQQRNGDLAFAEVAPEGTSVLAGDRFATIETIKVNIELVSPVSGVVIEVNDRVSLESEIINQDPYGDGWLAVVEASDWQADRAHLLGPEAYFAHIKREAEEEAGQ
jgi:glycine cleavage system H protein